MKYLVIISLALLGLDASAQTQKNLTVNCRIKSGDEPISYARVVIKSKSGKTIESLTNDTAGYAEFYFDFDLLRDVWFEADNHQTKIIRFDTRHVPGTEQEWGYEYGGFLVNLAPGNDSIPPAPIVVIKYDTNIENFQHELIEEK